MEQVPTILISINTSWNLYHFRASLIECLRGQGYRVITAAPDDVYTPRLMPLVDRHIRLPMDNAGTSPFYDSVLFARYLRLFRSVRPDLFLGYTIKPNIYGNLAAARFGVPTINNVSGLGTAFIKANWLTWVVKRLYRQAFRHSSLVFFQNPDDAQLFIAEQLVASSRVRFIPGSGIDLTYYTPSDEHLNQSGPRFILIARMLWDKGIGEYVDAARAVRAKYPKARFSLLGPTGIENKTAIARKTIEGWVKEGVIEYFGESEDVREYIAAHDCVVLPSYREGMSRVLLEAAAMGKPLIATDVPGCRHAVEHGQNGFLCRVRDANNLAQQLLAFIDLSTQARADMGAASRQKAETEFDEAIVHQHYLAAIESALSSGVSASG